MANYFKNVTEAQLAASPVASVGDLPTSGNSAGDLRVTLDTDKLYVWDADTSTWLEIGSGGGGGGAVDSVNTRTGAVVLTSADVGLSNVDNTSDANKPVSTATQTALDAKEDSITATTSADYYRGDKTFQPLNKAAVGLSDVDNTSDVDKPVSTAQQAEIDTKEDVIVAATSADYYRGDKTFQPLNKAAVGLSNVDNTSDASKPVSTATQTALNLKRDLSDNIDLTTEVTGLLPLANKASTPFGRNIYYDDKRVDSYTEDGSIERPFKSLAAVYAAITDQSAANPYVLRIAGGSNLIITNGTKLKPYIHLVGMGKEASAMRMSTTSNPLIVDFTGSTSRLLISNIRMHGTGGLTVDKTGATGGAWLGLENVSISYAFTYVGTGAGIDYLEMYNSRANVSGGTSTVSGVHAMIDNTKFYSSLTSTTAGATNGYSGYYTLLLMNSSYIQGALSVTAASGLPAIAQLYNTKGDANWTFTGTAALGLYLDSASGVYQGLTITKTGLVTTELYGSSENSFYSPAVSSDWGSTAPSNVKTALDALAAESPTLSAAIVLSDNISSPTTVLSYAASNTFALYEYSIKRDNNYRVGRLLLATDGTSVSLTDDHTEQGSTGITLSATVSGANVVIQYMSTNTGFNSSFKYFRKLWS